MLANNQPLGEFVPVPKNIMREAPSMEFSKQEQKVFWFIIEKTLGYEQYKDVNGKSVRVTQRTLAPSFFEKSIGVPKRTVRDALNSFKERQIINLCKKRFPDSSRKIQLMTTVEINLDTTQWKQKVKNRPFIGWSIKDIENPKGTEAEIQNILYFLGWPGEEYYGTREYTYESPGGVTEHFGDDVYHVLAELDPFHPELKRYYLEENGWGKNNKHLWEFGFQLYKGNKVIAESCWTHKEKLLEKAKAGDVNRQGILDMVLIENCEFCKSAAAGGDKISE